MSLVSALSLAVKTKRKNQNENEKKILVKTINENTNPLTKNED